MAAPLAHLLIRYRYEGTFTTEHNKLATLNGMLSAQLSGPDASGSSSAAISGSSESDWHRLLKILILAAVYFFFAILGLTLDPIGGFATLVWAPSGIAMAALFLWGPRCWPGIALGAFLANYVMGATFLTALGISLGNTLEGVVGARLLRHFGLQANLSRLHDVLNVLLSAAVSSTLISASIGVLSLRLSGTIAPAETFKTWSTWWLGDMTSCLLIVPLLLTWHDNPKVTLSAPRLLETSLLTLSLCSLSCLAFFFPGVRESFLISFFPRAYVLLPCFLWAAFRYGPRGAVTANSVVVFLGMLATISGYGPFNGATVSQRLTAFEVFSAVSTLVSLMLGALLVDRARMARELNKKDQICQTIGETLNFGIWIFEHKSGRHTYLSETFLRLVGRTQEECSLSSQWISFIHPDDIQTYLEAWQHCMCSNDTWDKEVRVKGVDGRWHPILSRGAPVRDEQGNIICWAGMHLDISRQRSTEEQLTSAKEQALASSAAKSRFLANMSHEIRTPLSVILGYSEFLADRGLPESEKAFVLDVIKRNGFHLSTLINDILDLSRVEAEQLIIHRTPTNLPTLVQEVHEVLHLAAQKKNLKLSFHLVDPLPIYIETDALRFKQILMNVIGNAIKFTSEGEVVGTLKIMQCAEAVALCCEITDTGQGIADEHLEELFKPFSQIDPSNTRNFGGTGLGLVLSKKLAQLLGGDLRLVRTVKGEGSSFEITIDPGTLREEMPLELVSLANAGQQADQHDLLKGTKILLVEDNDDIQAIVCKHLRCDGASVQIAPNGQRALEIVGQQAFDAILMDLQMPIMDGYEAVQQLRQRGCRTPIVALTAHVMEDERQRCLSAGFTAFIAKPIDRLILVQVLLGLLA